jgi:hypothetical protein
MLRCAQHDSSCRTFEKPWQYPALDSHGAPENTRLNSIVCSYRTRRTKTPGRWQMLPGRILVSDFLFANFAGVHFPGGVAGT